MLTAGMRRTTSSLSRSFGFNVGPLLNAHAERFVRSIRQECLNRTIPLGERHLRKLVYEYVAHYNAERNHQGLGNRLIEEPPGGLPRDGPIQCRKRLGGMLNYYYREAA